MENNPTNGPARLEIITGPSISDWHVACLHSGLAWAASRWTSGEVTGRRGSQAKGNILMKKLIGVTMMGVMFTSFGIGISGCSDESSETAKVVTKGPGGTTTQETQTSVKTSGENPPAPAKTP